MRRDLVKEIESRIDADDPECMNADEIEEWLESVTDETLWELFRECEISDGCLNIRARDIERAADTLLERQ